MWHSSVRSSLLPGLALILLATSARAQGDPPVGLRAAGMAGAFTAVADDATATVWNPAGLASASFFSLAIDGNSFAHRSALFAGMATPPLGVSYWRTATAELDNSRNTFVAHNFGVSLVQSLGDTGVAIGTTLKLVRGVVSTEEEPSTASTKFDADAGVMVSGGLGQIGLTVRNLTRPAFRIPGTAGGTIQLDRKVRGGVSVHVNDRTTIAGDVEFTKATALSGTWRDAAIGVEMQPFDSRTWVRGGLHWNTAGGGSRGSGAAPIAAFGASYAIHGALMAEAQASVGSAKGNRGWGVGVRIAF